MGSQNLTQPIQAPKDEKAQNKKLDKSQAQGA
jgi:hypothetical protein